MLMNGILLGPRVAILLELIRFIYPFTNEKLNGHV